MSAAFTPAPWDCTGCLFPDDDLGGVYYRVQAEGIDARAANARLIASAPTMYERLVVLVDVLSRLPATQNNDELWGAYTGAVAVLAQVRAEQVPA